MDITEKIINMRNFKTQQHILANCLNISDIDALTMLIDELMYNRLNKYSIGKLKGMIATHDIILDWDITHARQDLYRKASKEREKQSDLKYKLTQQNDYVINISDVKGISDSNKEKVIKLLPQLFSNNSTQEFIRDVLMFGKLETQSLLSMNEKQFNKKLQNIEYFCRKHKEKFINIVVNREDEKLLSEQDVLNELEAYISREDFDADLFQSLINKHKIYLDDLLGDYVNYPVNPVRLLNEFGKQPHKEQYKLVNCISDRLKEVGDKLR